MVHKPSTRHNVGIFSRSAEEDYSWLQTRLRSDGFRDRVQEVRSCYVSSSGYRQFYQDVSQCSFGILYHSKNRGRVNVTDVRDALYNDELRYLSDTLGREKVVVVIDDLDDCGPDVRSRILQNQPSIKRLAGDLILCDREKPIECLIKALSSWNLATQQEVASTDSKTTQKTSSSSSASSTQYGDDPVRSLNRLPIKSVPKRSGLVHGGGDLSDPPRLRPEGSSSLSRNDWQSYPFREDQERSNKERKTGYSSKQHEEKAVVSSGKHEGGWINRFTSACTSIKQTFSSTWHDVGIFSSTRHDVGIFSRSAEEHYSWLQTRLKSDGFSHCVREVRSCYISSSGFQQFYQDVSQCSFGILYHTKNRGIINVTDVTSALYNDELKYLSDTLGKENVVVLIDDLKDSSSEQKTWILESQPSIGRLARNLILINESNKESLISSRELFYEKI